VVAWHGGPARKQSPRRVAEGQVEKLERGVPAGDGRDKPIADDTLKVSRRGYSERETVKIRSGGDVKAPPRWSEEDPRELKTHEGIESRRV
jgi:hypothetical protein